MDFSTSWGILESMIKGFFSFCYEMLTNYPWYSLMFIMILITPAILDLIINYLETRKLKKSGMLEVDKMSGEQFEKYLAVLFKAQGYRVKTTAATGDFGADLILSSNDRKIVIQAKRYKKNVGVSAVQEIVSAKSYYSANECWVVTNSNFTGPAKKLATSNQVKLINRDILQKWMLELKKNNQNKGEYHL